MAKRLQRDPQSELRARAEAKLADDEAALDNVSAEEMSRLIHELRTHQVELQLQNEELRQAQEELADSRDQYVSLYDFAPIGYATVSTKGIIQQANLRLTEMAWCTSRQTVGTPSGRVRAPRGCGHLLPLLAQTA